MSKENKRTPKRRANGEGTISELDDGRFLAIAPADKAGRRPKKTVRTRTEAVQFIKSIEAKRRQKLNLGSCPTFKIFASDYFDQEIKPTVGNKTYANYQWILSNCLLPRLGKLILTDISRKLIIELYNELREEGYSNSTVKNSSSRLIAIFDAAILHRYIDINPARGIKLPKPNVRDRHLTIPQILAVIKAAQHYSNGLIYDIIISLGLRKGEALGLRWCDWNREEHMISIEQQVVDINGEVIISPHLKTPAARRKNPVPARIEAKLYEFEVSSQYLGARSG